MRLRTDNTYRACSRCGKELTDPASRECGVGPICRGKDNHLYAKLIEANIPMATALFMGTHPEELPLEVEGRFMTANKSFIKKMEKVQSANEDVTIMRLTGADFRDEVRTLDYILSFRVSSETRDKLVGVVRYLGYVGLAAVLSGEASKSSAKVWFENGRVFLQGTGCTSGFQKMKRIRGIQTPAYRGSKDPYSAPGNQCEKFLDVVSEHWPLYDGDLDAVRTAAVNWTKANSKAIQAEKASLDQKDLLGKTTTAAVTLRSDDFILSFKWLKTANMQGMINELKEIPKKERAYNPINKNWMFRKQHFDAVKTIVGNVYETIVIQDHSETTPPEEWKKTNPYPKRAMGRRPGYWRY